MKWFALYLLVLTGWLTQSAFADDPLYQDLGGQAGITAIIQEAVTLFFADDRVKADFDNINPDHLKTRLVEKFCQIAGGPCVYHGHSIKATHVGLDLNRAKFNAVAEDVQTAMEHVGIPYWTQNRLMARLAPMQRDVVTR